MNETAAALRGATLACAGAASVAGMWLYGQLISNPLRVMYFKGYWGWGNIPIHEICNRIAANPNGASFWARPGNLDECREMLEMKFESYESTAYVVIWFTVLTFAVLQLLCQCCLIRPLVRGLSNHR